MIERVPKPRVLGRLRRTKGHDGERHGRDVGGGWAGKRDGERDKLRLAEHADLPVRHRGGHYDAARHHRHRHQHRVVRRLLPQHAALHDDADASGPRRG